MKARQFMLWGSVVAGMLPAVVWAHVGQDGVSANFMAGAHHPFSGLDHLLAMLAVGIWAAQNGGRSVWMVPTAFVSLMLAGAAMGLAGVGLPFVEQSIVASLLVLGLLIAGACKLDSLIGVLIVGFFAVFHGHAHGAEIPDAGDIYGYCIGFALATAFLHGLGIGAVKLTQQWLARFAGAAIALSGVYLAVA